VAAFANYKRFGLADRTEGVGGEYDSRKRMENLAYYNLHHPLGFFLQPQYSLSDIPTRYFPIITNTMM
jgi:hypothetical protein